ncbi:MAG: fibronectin type III domain-containing protein, partial [Deltaproteobacteria bacterium]|nr:fibronectin type III domain-containing protein [Deltaproteobacteria bacterium]
MGHTRYRFHTLVLIPLLILAAIAAVKTEINGAEFHLTWLDNANNESGFDIERKTGASGTFVPIASVGPNISFYHDSGLADGTTYCYRVRAFNESGYSSYSNDECSSTTTPAPTNYTLNLAKGGDGGGTVTSSPSGINCGTDCSETYVSGSS